MAVTQVGNRVYARITDLTEESSLNNGDKFIFHCASTGNASLIDWSNVKIDLDHCTFGPTFSEMLNFTQTATAWVSTMTESFQELEAKCNDTVEMATQMNNTLEALKMLVKLIIGLAYVDENHSNYRPDEYAASLNAEAKAIYDQIINDVKTASGLDISFAYQNLLWASRAKTSSGDENS